MTVTDGEPILRLGVPASAVARERWTALTAWVVLLVVASVAHVLLPHPVVAIVAGLLVALSALATVVEALVLIPARRRAFRLEVTASAITVSRGRWVRRTDVIPLERVTVVRTRTGLWARRYRHCDITVVATTTEVSLPPLSRSDADVFASVVTNCPLGRDAAPQ